MLFVYYFLLFAFLVAGLALAVVNLPGLWLMALAAGVYAAVSHFQFVTVKVVVVLLGLALVAEIIDTLSAGAGAKRAGASRRGLIGAVIGGLVGALFFSLPIPVIGTVAGLCIGTFAGALIAELTAGKEMGQSMLIGVGAVKGRLLGILFKLMFGCVMILITMAYGWPSHTVRLTRPVVTTPVVAPTLPPTTGKS